MSCEHAQKDMVMLREGPNFDLLFCPTCEGNVTKPHPPKG